MHRREDASPVPRRLLMIQDPIHEFSPCVATQKEGSKPAKMEQNPIDNRESERNAVRSPQLSKWLGVGYHFLRWVTPKLV